MTPPPLPPASLRRSNGRSWVVGLIVVGVITIFGIIFLVKTILDSGITAGPDKMFGDQHLKTAVALIELHKVRHGSYPASLKDLTFTGQWDALALQSVAYYPSPARDSYYVEVERGWIGKPKLEMPPEFWQGTGYSEKLKPKPK